MLLIYRVSSTRKHFSPNVSCPFHIPFHIHLSLTHTRTLRMEDDENQLTPVITDDGYTFLYIKHNNLYCKAHNMVARRSQGLIILLWLARSFDFSLAHACSFFSQ